METLPLPAAEQQSPLKAILSPPFRSHYFKEQIDRGEGLMDPLGCLSDNDSVLSGPTHIGDIPSFFFRCLFLQSVEFDQIFVVCVHIVCTLCVIQSHMAFQKI